MRLVSSTAPSPPSACARPELGRRGEAGPMDATTLTNAAAVLEGHGEVLIARAHQLARHGAAMRWHSPAARRCRSVLETLCCDLLASGSAATELADRMRRCAVRAK